MCHGKYVAIYEAAGLGEQRQDWPARVFVVRVHPPEAQTPQTLQLHVCGLCLSSQVSGQK